MVCHHWFRHALTPNRRQAITPTNVDKDLWHHIVLPGQDGWRVLDAEVKQCYVTNIRHYACYQTFVTHGQRLTPDIITRTYGIVVFDNELLEAGVTQEAQPLVQIWVTLAESGSLSNSTTTYVLIFIMHAEFNCVTYVLF